MDKPIGGLDRDPRMIRAAHLLPPSELTQDFLARDFVVTNRDRLRFDHYRGRWFLYDEATGIWRADETQVVLNEVRAFLAARDNPSKPTLTSRRFIADVEDLARCDPDIACTSSEWDADPYILGTPGVNVELKTGLLLTPCPKRMLTLSTSVPIAEGEPEVWLRFLLEATGGNVAYVDYLQRVAGYLATGDIKEHILFFLWGPGGSGKSTLVETLQFILGSYAWAAPMEMFCAAHWRGHPTEIASLQGRRMVTANETQQGRAWDEARIKSLTGGDTISARFMRKDFFQFSPTHKLVIVGNHAPSIQSTGPDMQRRFHILPFEHPPVTIDHNLREKLRDKLEAGRILGWIVRGALQWQQRGLYPPDIVQTATARYFEDQDVFADWLREATVLNPEWCDTSVSLYASYARFMKASGEEALSQKSFGHELRRRGFERITKRIEGRPMKTWKGIKAAG
jgi:putative DNA primase/helicase